MDFDERSKQRIHSMLTKTFNKSTSDFYFGKKVVENWTLETVRNYYNYRLETDLNDPGGRNGLIIQYKFLAMCNCVDVIEFSERIVDPIVNRLCIKYGLEYDEVKERLRLACEEDL